MNLRVLVLPGDGIGTEVTREAVRVLRYVAGKWNHPLHIAEGLLGGIAIHRTGSPFPEETARLAADADATLLGAVGLPEFDNCPPEKRPEKGLLGIRKALGVFANLRPVRTFAKTPSALRTASSPFSGRCSGGQLSNSGRPTAPNKVASASAARRAVSSGNGLPVR